MKTETSLFVRRLAALAVAAIAAVTMLFGAPASAIEPGGANLIFEEAPDCDEADENGRISWHKCDEESDTFIDRIVKGATGPLSVVP